jgi:hypothetical protein
VLDRLPPRRLLRRGAVLHEARASGLDFRPHGSAAVLLFPDFLLVGFTFYIAQNIQEDYGMFVWPCSVILAEYVWQHRSRFSASRVVEVLLVLIFVFVQFLIHQSPMWYTCYCGHLNMPVH